MSQRAIPLHGHGWRLGQAPAGADPARAAWAELERVTEWLPATVPGNVRADLVRAGRLPDLTWGRNAADAAWVDDHCWWLVRDFACAPAPGERVHLVLRGVDYIGDLFLNGRFLGRHEGMFSPQVHDVTDLLTGDDRLAVRILGNRWLPRDRSGLRLKLLNRLEERLNHMPGLFPDRRDTLKCQMGFGWDFAPPLRTLGIWDDVYLLRSGDAFLRDLVVRSEVAETRAALTLTVEIDARRGGPAQLRVTLTGRTFEAAPLTVERSILLPPGPSRHTLALTIPRPRLWQPWDQGEPHLYDLEVQVRRGGKRSDALRRAVGLRRLEWKGRQLYLNGRRVPIRGANWVPADILPGRVGAGDYRALLTLAREANMNMLRVWGGGLRERRAFYDLCDRLGILVWQEFPFACAFVTRYPRSPDYLQLVETEVRAIVRDLRRHPSIVLWCGGNEFNPDRNKPLVRTLRRVVEQEDPTRPFVPASPSAGDGHNWQVWHRFYPPARYREDTTPFVSEFGLQAPPDAAALRRFIPPEELWPPGPSWTFHGAGLAKLWRYARPFLPEGEPDLDAFVTAAQRAQAWGLQIAVEHYRRNGTGVLLWQFNEPWSAISWAILTYERRPKPAYHLVQRLFAPLLVGADYTLQPYRSGDPFAADIWLINDLPRAFPACTLTVTLWDARGQAARQMTQAVDVAAQERRTVARFTFPLPPGDRWRLTCRLERKGRTLTANEYDLAVYDDDGPSWWQRLIHRLADIVT